ncbi:hypothetical protein BCR34DRAFT_22783 [Clohesyomyces aquaticus]|uniref:Uncharacterized protein n=1 Tax=Clohesyomyces aquaticus TaxID=1231657 RepID=A0A1Y2A5P8_9PLEO|nr:hypothetical protein BCR34DRAFT_22783 [Clohesyomyces aquaticus]
MDPPFLNRCQIRSRNVLQSLQNLHPDHLDTFLEGVGEIEPPRYQFLNGAVRPPLTLVDYKESAKTYDFGNVFLEDSTLCRIVLQVEDNGKFSRHQKEPLDRSQDNPLATPLPGYLIKDFTKHWKAKFEAIKERKAHINSVRQYAHHDFSQKTKRSNFDGNNDSNYKRKSGDPISRHPANKRIKVGLDSIPDSAKSEAFGRIPDQVKTQLFDVVIKTAFPNFENVMMAAWNTVTVYESVGTDFPDLHGAMTDLKSVLREFEASYGKKKLKRESQQNTNQNANQNANKIANQAQSDAVVQQKSEEPMSRSNASTPEEEQGLFVSEKAHDQVAKSVEKTGNSQQVPPRQAPTQEVSVPESPRGRNEASQQTLDNIRSVMTPKQEGVGNDDRTTRKSPSLPPNPFVPDGPRLPGMDPGETLSNGRYPVDRERRANKSPVVLAGQITPTLTRRSDDQSIEPSASSTLSGPRRDRDSNAIQDLRNARSNQNSQIGSPSQGRGLNGANSRYGMFRTMPNGSGAATARSLTIGALDRISNSGSNGAALTAPMAHTLRDHGRDVRR